MLGAGHGCLIEYLLYSWDEGASITPIAQKRRLGLKEVKGLAYNCVDLGHGGKAGFFESRQVCLFDFCS